MSVATQNRVFVLDKDQQPLMPCHPARARQLLRKGQASVYRRFPFTVILHQREGGCQQPLQLKWDPGSKTRGLAIVAACQRERRCLWAAELTHRGRAIQKSLAQRRGVRRSRRHRKTRYRQPHFDNRPRPKGWLAPSLQSRMDNMASWTRKLRRFAPETSLSMELVRFDLQALQNPEISGVAYQQGELQGYEVREYVLEKWSRRCAYCGIRDVPLQIEHLISKAQGGSDRVTNLTLSCQPCNQKKGAQTAREFGFPELQARANQPLRDAAAVNTTRFAVLRVLKETGLPVETGTGGRTKFNRSQQGYPKRHRLDAVCVGASGEKVFADPGLGVLGIQAMGRGSRQKCRVNRYGFPRTKAKGAKRVKGFQTGDLVRAVVPRGKKAGVYTGRVAVRSSGSFNVKSQGKTLQGISANYCFLLQRVDGYNYENKERDSGSSHG